MHRCGVPEATAPCFFHIPLSDQSCRLTEAWNSSDPFHWHSQQRFPRKRPTPAGLFVAFSAVLLLFHFLHCLNAQFTGIIGLTLWETFDSVRGVGGNMSTSNKHPALSAPYLQLQLPRSDTSRDWGFNKTSCTFIFFLSPHICFSCCRQDVTFKTTMPG